MPPPIWQGRLRQRKTHTHPQLHPDPTQGKHSLIASLSGPHDPQNSCPFFNTLPTEIRHIIYTLALLSYDDKTRPYPDEPYFSRHGYRFHQLIATSLLQTCRRIYCETHDWPVGLNVHVFCYGVTIDPQRHFCDNPLEYFARFTDEQKGAADRAHIFVSLRDWGQIDGSLPVDGSRPLTNVRNSAAEESDREMRVKNIKLTVSYKHWWPWHVNPILTLASQWGEKLKFMIHGLESLEVEIDTIEQNKHQIEAIANSMHRFQFTLHDSRILTTEDNPVKRVQYLAEPVVYQQARHVAHPVPHYPPSPIPFIVTTFRWTEKRQDKDQNGQSSNT